MEARRKKIVTLFVLIFVLVVLLFLVFVVVNSEGLSQDSFLDVDHVVLSVLLEEGASYSTTLSVENLLSETVSVAVLPSLEEMSVTPSAFSLSPGASEDLLLNFLSSDPGVFVGLLLFQAEEKEQSLPIVLEVESAEGAFDVQASLSLYNVELQPGENALFTITVYDLTVGQDVHTVDLAYTLLDQKGDIVTVEQESVVFSSQATEVQTLALPKSLEEGSYVYAVVAEIDGKVATSSTVVTVVDGGFLSSLGAVCSASSYFCGLISLIVFLLLFFLGVSVFLVIRQRFPKKVKKQRDSISSLLLVLIFIFLVALLFFLVFNLNFSTSYFSAVPSFVYWLFLILLAISGLVYYLLRYPHLLRKRRDADQDLDQLRVLWKERQREKQTIRKKLDVLVDQMSKEERSVREQQRVMAEKKDVQPGFLHRWFRKSPEKQKALALPPAPSPPKKKATLPPLLKIRKEEVLIEKKPFFSFWKKKGVKKVALPLLSLKQRLPVVEKKAVVEVKPVLEEKVPLPLFPPKILVSPKAFEPWEQTVVLVNKCERCLKKNNLDLAEVYYEELKPLFLKLSRDDKNEVYPRLVDLQNKMVMLRFRIVREGLRPHRRKKKV